MPYNTHLWEKHNNGLTAVFSTPDALIECQLKTLLTRKVLIMINISKNTPVISNIANETASVNQQEPAKNTNLLMIVNISMVIF
ncbi:MULTISPECIES: hypothetical protein [unclassified Bartonella]|uniref:hypothetical protein n=1 Tax=unclassified Bartonella TaxID=2645622 RepID=UPI0035D0BA15